MKRKGTDISSIPREEPLLEADEFHQKRDLAAGTEEGWAGQGVFLMEEGRLQPFLPQNYTTATLYEVVESFQVESRFVRPEEPGNLIIEGKRPTKRTVPILIFKSGDCALLESWEKLEAEPSKLADVGEVIGAIPVKQVFVLKRR